MNDYGPKWVYFAIYGVGLTSCNFRPVFDSNLTLYSLDYRQSYYNFAKGLFDRLFQKILFSYIKRLTTKNVYDMLLKDVFILPIDKNSEVYFKIAFQAVHSDIVDPEVRVFSYKLPHDAVPTNAFR